MFVISQLLYSIGIGENDPMSVESELKNEIIFDPGIKKKKNQERKKGEPWSKGTAVSTPASKSLGEKSLCKTREREREKWCIILSLWNIYEKILDFFRPEIYGDFQKSPYISDLKKSIFARKKKKHLYICLENIEKSVSENFEHGLRVCVRDLTSIFRSTRYLSLVRNWVRNRMRL